MYDNGASWPFAGYRCYLGRVVVEPGCFCVDLHQKMPSQVNREADREAAFIYQQSFIRTLIY